MANEFCEILILEKPLEIARHEPKPDEGAVVEFRGIVREGEDGKMIGGIFYEAHEAMARHQIETIACDAREKFGCGDIVLHHRIGFVPAAEPSLFVRVTAKHRGPAFAACEWIIEQLKQRAPIWKRPQFETESRPYAENLARQTR